MKNNFDYKIAHLEEILTNDKYKQALKNLKYEEKQISSKKGGDENE